MRRHCLGCSSVVFSVNAAVWSEAAQSVSLGVCLDVAVGVALGVGVGVAVGVEVGAASGRRRIFKPKRGQGPIAVVGMYTTPLSTVGEAWTHLVLPCPSLTTPLNGTWRRQHLGLLRHPGQSLAIPATTGR